MFPCACGGMTNCRVIIRTRQHFGGEEVICYFGWSETICEFDMNLLNSCSQKKNSKSAGFTQQPDKR